VSIVESLERLGYQLEPMPLQRRSFHVAVRSGNLVFTSGQLPTIGATEVKGQVGDDVDVDLAYKAAEICAVNCLRAVAAVADLEDVARVVKVLGMVNCAPGFTNTSAVINGATDLLNAVMGDGNTHARSAVGMVLPDNWAVEVEIIAEVRS
jgi:enamine deaminase RidA (YjgF/YER057c/UK114 family)